jgi:hypothetical protein
MSGDENILESIASEETGFFLTNIIDLKSRDLIDIRHEISSDDEGDDGDKYVDDYYSGKSSISTREGLSPSWDGLETASLHFDDNFVFTNESVKISYDRAYSDGDLLRTRHLQRQSYDSSP